MHTLHRGREMEEEGEKLAICSRTTVRCCERKRVREGKSRVPDSLATLRALLRPRSYATCYPRKKQVEMWVYPYHELIRLSNIISAIMIKAEIDRDRYELFSSLSVYQILFRWCSLPRDFYCLLEKVDRNYLYFWRKTEHFSKV